MDTRVKADLLQVCSFQEFAVASQSAETQGMVQSLPKLVVLERSGVRTYMEPFVLGKNIPEEVSAQMKQFTK